jgi:D-alanine-D-alanine ligase
VADPLVAILHDRVDPSAPIEERDLLVQVDAVAGALAELGCAVARVPLTLDLEAARSALRREAPDLVFNLAEGLGGNGRLSLLGPLLLEEMELPYTGTGLEGMAISSSKLLAKRVLTAAGLPTPPWIALDRSAAAGWAGSWIVKSVWEHASVGMDDGAVVADGHVEEVLAARRANGGEWFAEAYVDGREINLALLARGNGPRGDTEDRSGSDGESRRARDLDPLPPAEILFDEFPSGKPHIVSHAAKWEEASFEYQHARRTLDFAASDAALLGELEALGRRCARACSLAGYARIDVRVDAQRRPWVIDVNANPCLSPDAGLVANAERAGLSYVELVARIAEGAGLELSLRRPVEVARRRRSG